MGGRVAEFLVRQPDYEVLLGSRQEMGEPSWLPQVKVAKINWEACNTIEEACSNVHTVIHLAGMNAQDCMSNPTEALNVNAVATSRLLQVAIRQRVKRFIYLSSAHVYGSPLTGTINEDTCPSNLHPYATSNRAGEDLIRAAHQRKEIEGIVIRLSNAYGVPMHIRTNCWMLLINDLCRHAVTERQLHLDTNGLQYRDFITLTDTTRAIKYLLDCSLSKLGDGLFNLGGNNPLRVIDLTELIAERCYATLGFRPTIQRPEEKKSTDTPQLLDYRIDKLLGTGFQLKGKINDEIDATLKFCNMHFKAKD